MKLLKEEQTPQSASHKVQDVSPLFATHAQEQLTQHLSPLFLSSMLKKLNGSQKLLQESNTKFQQIFDNSVDIIYFVEVTPEGRFIHLDVNAAYVKAVGMPYEVIVGHYVDEIENVSFRKTLLDKYSSCLKAGTQVDYIAQYSFSHSSCTYHSTLSPIRDASGRIYRIVGVARDITALKEQEMALMGKEQEYRTIMENAPDYVARFDSQGRLFYTNPPLTTLLESLGKGDAISHTPAQLSKSGNLYVLDRTIQNVLKNGRLEQLILSYPTAQGNIVYQEIVCAPERTLRGKIIGVLAFGRDVTARIELQEALLTQERNARMLIENIPDHIVRYDRACRAIYVSPSMERVFGEGGLEKFLGKTPLEGDDTQAAYLDYEASIRKVIESGETCELEMTLHGPDGTMQYHFVRFVPEKDRLGNLVSVLAIGMDVTQAHEQEMALQAQKEAYYSLAENVPDNIARWDTQGHYLYINPTHEKTIGKSLQEIVGTPIPPSHTEVWAAMNEALSGVTKTVRQHVVDEQGGVTIHDVTVTPEYDSQGTIVSLLGLGRDVTQIVQLQEALKERETHYRNSSNLLSAVLESSPDVAVFALDSSYRYVAFNQKHFRGMQVMWGCEIAVGMNMLECITDAKDRRKAKALFDQTLVGESFIDEAQYGEERLSRSYWETYYAPVLDERKKIVGLTCYNINITDRKAQEQKLQETKAKLSSVIATIPDLVWVKDAEGVYLLCNEAFERFFGAPASEILGKTDYDFIAKEQADFFRQKDREAMQAGEMRINEEEIVFAHNGQHAILETRKVPVYDGKTFMGVLGIGRDITQRKIQEEQLALLSHAINSASEMIFLLRTDVPQFVYANTVASQHLGYTHEELIGGMGVYDLDPHLKDPERWNSFVARLKELGDITMYTEHRTKKGDIYPVELRLSFVKHDVKNYILAIAKDVTAQRAQEAELIAKERHFRSLAENSPDVIIRYDLNGVYQYANPSAVELFGRPYEEIVGKNVRETAPAFMLPFLAEYYDLLERLIQKGENGSHQMALPDGKGGMLYHSVEIILEKDANNEPISVLTVGRDITQQHRMHQELQESQKRLIEAQRIAKIGSWELEFPSLKLLWSSDIYTIFEIEPQLFEPSYDHFLNAVHPEDREMVDVAFAQSLSTKTPYDIVHRLLMADGRIKYVHEKGQSFYDEQGEPLRSFGTVQDITHQKAVEKKIEYLAHHDALTGLPNRLLTRQRTQEAIERAALAGTQVALLFIDLDGFKIINDTMGHTVGDSMLKMVANRLAEGIRPIDTIGRQGGDEFLLLMANIDTPEDAIASAQHIVERFEQPFVINEQALSISASIGIALFPMHGESFELLLQNSDTAMYKAKEQGKNTYCLYTQQMSHHLKGQLRLQNDLKWALHCGEFFLHYQPQINLESHTVVGAEALLRWNHPQLGIISPAEFIPLAESTGAIASIGQWVIEEACAQAVRWHRQNIPITIAVNISAVQFKRGDLEKIVKDALHHSKLPAYFLELELTESILISDTDNALRTLRALKEIGVRLSIDDFGTGYSSLSYLKRFAVDKLKIDQSFVRDILRDPEDAVIVRTIIQMAKSLNLVSIAEGVENREVLNVLEMLGCDEVQGYHFAKPMPEDEFESFYRHFLLLKNK